MTSALERLTDRLTKGLDALYNAEVDEPTRERYYTRWMQLLKEYREMSNVEEAKLAAGILEEAGWFVSEVKVNTKDGYGNSTATIRATPPEGRGMLTVEGDVRFIQDRARVAVADYKKERE